jgi:hypothetical protein
MMYCININHTVPPNGLPITTENIMSKPMVGDKVAVLKVHADTDTRFVAVSGTLTSLDKGRKTEDKRAHAEEGDCPPESAVDAKGWCLVTLDDGRVVSSSLKEVVLHTQKVVLEHNATMAQVALVQDTRKVTAHKLEQAKVLCADKGLDVSTLTDANLLKLQDLLK